MGVGSFLTGGVVKSVGDTASRIVESKDLTARAKAEALSEVDQALLENAAAINAGRSTWRPKWMDAIRRLLLAYFAISFGGSAAVFLALVTVFAGWSQYSQWAAVKDELVWLIEAWAGLGASLIGIATWSFLGYSPFRSIQQIAANGDDSSIVTRAIKRVMPGHQPAPEPIVIREEIRTPSAIDRLDGIVVPEPERVVKTKALPLDVNQLSKEIISEESTVYHVYLDSKGHKTAGIGHLLKESTDPEYAWDIGTPVSRERVQEWYRDDLQSAINDARAVVRNFNTLPHEARLVLCNMAFQMGRENLREFVKTIPLIEQGKWLEASTEMKDSQWYRSDSPARASRMAMRIRALA